MKSAQFGNMSIDCIPAALPLGSIKSSSRYPQPDRETSSINAFYNHKMSYWAELESYQPLPLCTCGAHDTLATQMEQDKVIRLDWSRNTSWSKSRSLQMRTWEGETTSFQFYSMRKQDSLRWPMHHNIKASALLARGHWSFTNHTTQSGRGRNGGLNRPVCSHCGKPNHTVDRCWELHGKPDDLPKSMERKREISPHTQL